MNLKLFAAIFFLSFGAVVYMIGKPKLSKEFQALETAQAWNGGGQPQESELLLLTGAIAASQDSIWDGFVVANRELFTGTGKLNGWKVDKAFLNPFYLKAEKGMVKVQLKEVPDQIGRASCRERV